MHGSPEAKEAGDVEVQQHHKLVARNKYLHGFEGAWSFRESKPGALTSGIVHHVKPDQVTEYRKAAYVVCHVCRGSR